MPSAGTDKSASQGKPREVEVADSWEDELDEDSDKEPTPSADFEERTIRQPQSTSTAARPKEAPSRKAFTFGPDGTPILERAPRRQQLEDRRPEKTNAVASRLIAGALGVRTPRRTEEQRAYDASVKEAERKARESRRKAEEEEKKVREGVWDS